MVSDIIAAMAGVVPLDMVFLGNGAIKKPSDEHVTIVEQETEDAFEADNVTVQTARYMDVNIFLRGDYQARVRRAYAQLRESFIVDDRRYVAYEDDVGLHHYVISVIENNLEE